MTEIRWRPEKEVSKMCGFPTYATENKKPSHDPQADWGRQLDEEVKLDHVIFYRLHSYGNQMQIFKCYLAAVYCLSDPVIFAWYIEFKNQNN